ncbi:hypothetical protein HF329_15400 [Chitinophaga oryzae]|uniref:Uncharacterized protein n=1 Tax=Chitinophaga oryzae TaxID=2725414 RepID=A0AAE6ZH68_9BACT|nr:hypothetical protein [Chitinophaga oryzae]QJB32631.1 hypothetical protein HF329_15400 [Chitinophaga oryzae]
MKKLIVFFVTLTVIVVASASLALKARVNHSIYTRNLANGLCDIKVNGKAILNTTTFGFLATNVPGPCELVITTNVVD